MINDYTQPMIITESQRNGMAVWYITRTITFNEGKTARRVRDLFYTKESVFRDVHNWEGPIKFRVAGRLRRLRGGSPLKNT